MANATADLPVERLLDRDKDVQDRAEALARGQPGRSDIIRTVVADNVREIV